MPNYWCVNFESVGGLHHGIRNKLWLMGYQYAKKGGDTPGRKSAITRNWNRLAQVAVGDSLLDDWQNKWPLRGDLGDRPGEWLEVRGRGTETLITTG